VQARVGRAVVIHPHTVATSPSSVAALRLSTTLAPVLFVEPKKFGGLRSGEWWGLRLRRMRGQLGVEPDDANVHVVTRIEQSSSMMSPSPPASPLSKGRAHPYWRSIATQAEPMGGHAAVVLLVGDGGGFGDGA
jgi:hypothetical protein